MSGFEHRITNESTDLEKTFLTFYDGNLWTALKYIRYWKSPLEFDALVQQVSALTIENEKLKADKQLVVVPKFVAKYIQECDGDYTIYGSLQKLAQKMSRTDIYKWVFASKERQEAFACAWLDGYTVEKENLYILKHIDMSKLYTDVSLYLAHGFCKELDHVFYKDVNVHNADECHFTQSEIDKLNIGSYEKIEVEP